MKTLKNLPYVRNMISSKGNLVINQFEIYAPNLRIFQSYNTIIAVVDTDTESITLDKDDWNYSATTSKYRNIFLDMNTQETRKAIKDGTIKLADLNK